MICQNKGISKIFSPFCFILLWEKLRKLRFLNKNMFQACNDVMGYVAAVGIFVITEKYVLILNGDSFNDSECISLYDM